jgi:glycine/D-amino acid oxidase-like deaminating enzyme
VQRRIGRFYSTWVAAGEPLRDPSQWPGSALIWETARPYLYARLTDDGRPLVGGEDEPFTFRHNSERRRARKTRRLLKRFATILPGVEVEPVYQWAGVFSSTKDGLPYIGTLPEHPRAWMALGYGGNGITFSMIAAGLIRDAWLGVKNDLATIFRFDR